MIWGEVREEGDMVGHGGEREEGVREEGDMGGPRGRGEGGG